LYAPKARRQLLGKSQDKAALQLPTDDYPALRINAVDLKRRLGDIETDCCNTLHAWLL
jgi:hypothetical protein